MSTINYLISESHNSYIFHHTFPAPYTVRHGTNSHRHSCSRIADPYCHKTNNQLSGKQNAWTWLGRRKYMYIWIYENGVKEFAP